MTPALLAEPCDPSVLGRFKASVLSFLFQLPTFAGKHRESSPRAQEGLARVRGSGKGLGLLRGGPQLPGSLSEKRRLGWAGPALFHGCEIGPVCSKRPVTQQVFIMYGTIEISKYSLLAVCTPG